MKKPLFIAAAAFILSASTVSIPALAAPGGGGGQHGMGNSQNMNGMAQEHMQKSYSKGDDTMDEHGVRDRDRQQEQDRLMDKAHSPNEDAMAKQRERKMEQEQKETGKGSEQGQESREKRRKWWRFWE